MDEVVMTNDELNAWRMIGADIGLQFDELGHPYKLGPARDRVALEFYSGAYDWRPLECDSDCLGLMLHYRMKVNCELDCVYVYARNGLAPTIVFYKSEYTHEATLRRAVFECAARVVRERLAELDKQPVCSKEQ